MKHSSVVGGSTAKRVINCPASVKLVSLMPPKPSSKYADEGTLCHNVMDLILNGKKPDSLLGMTYEGQTMTQELYERKIIPALALLDELDPTKEMEYATEVFVSFGTYLPDAFGSNDVLGRLHDRAIILDWKFGDGVVVEAEENEQLMFYAAAAMRTPSAMWAFEDATQVEMVIIQPPMIKRWVTTLDRIKQFETDLFRAVKLATRPDAPMKTGEHCRWCAAKPTCPQMTGAVERALHSSLDKIDAPMLSELLNKAELLEQWLTDARALAHQMLDAGKVVPGYKLVAKRATRQWVSEDDAIDTMVAMGVPLIELIETTVLSPAKSEKVLKKHGKQLPADQVVAVSSGSTLVAESDPRPAVLNIGVQLTAALSKLQ